MKTIVRIEHEDGYGVFADAYEDRTKTRYVSCRYICETIWNRHFDFPIPYEDNLILEQNDFCAYKSVDQIKEWITEEEFKILFENKYKVFLIKVSEVKEGKFQYTFKKENIISKKNISNKFKCKLAK